MAKILEAEPFFSQLKEKIKAEIRLLPPIVMASIRVCDAYCSDVYFSSQKKLAQELGVGYMDITLKPNDAMTQMLTKIEECNADPRVKGIIAHKPFPKSWTEEVVFSHIASPKDIEGMNPANLGRIFMGEPEFISPTVLSVLEFLSMAGVELYGKEVVLVGFSTLIGKPLALLLGKALATVTIAHIATYERERLPYHIKRADVVISAVGKPHLVKGEWIKEGAVVIDVGIGEKDGRIVGDVEFDSCLDRASAITPVPGGVGKLTTLFLFKNLLKAAQQSI